SRRRHTRWPRDWSSDVCSSDLGTGTATQAGDDVIDIAEERVLTSSRGSMEKALHHPGLTERVVASFGRTVAGRLALCMLFGAFKIGRASCRERGESADGVVTG